MTHETETTTLIGQPSADGSAAVSASRKLERETRTRSLAGWRMVGQCSPGPGVIVCTWERSRSSP